MKMKKWSADLFQDRVSFELCVFAVSYFPAIFLRFQAFCRNHNQAPSFFNKAVSVPLLTSLNRLRLGELEPGVVQLLTDLYIPVVHKKTELIILNVLPQSIDRGKSSITKAYLYSMRIL